MALTVKRVERAKQPGRYGDGHGLYLQVTKAGVKSWLLRYMVDGRERFMGLGPLHTVDLTEARERARRARLLLLDGVDPIAARHAEKAVRRAAQAKLLTFAEAARTYHAQHESKWKNIKHAAQFINTLKQYAFPVIGQFSVGEIDRTHVLRVLEQGVAAERGYPAGTLWSARPETASRLRGRIESVLAWCTVRGFRAGENPATWKGHLQHALPARGAAVKNHYPALPYAAVPAFLVELRERGGVAARALEFCVLTAARTSEVVGATWAEVNLDEAVWAIPPSRMKAGKEHRVPLSDRAVELLSNVYCEDGNDFVFIGAQSGEGLSNMAMAAVLKRMGRADVTVHGFRSAFMDWAHERSNFPKTVIDQALAHVVGDKVEAAYRRGDLFSKRKALMAAWSTFCSKPVKAEGAAVVPLRGRAT